MIDAALVIEDVLFMNGEKLQPLLVTGLEHLKVGKRCRVYPLDPRPDAVGLYPLCTPGKHRAWILLVDRHAASLVGLRGGWRHGKIKLCFAPINPSQQCPGKGLVLPTTITIYQIASHSRFFILSLPNCEMSKKSPFAIQKALQGIGEPKSDDSESHRN
ncbi:hypothetical protein TNCV_3413631 [Trichonephila clavipes]|uniref:Uncharacterized protein n=1 Tax=Trichonephila clavipes TaxID=2585209 RepID=A0A8X6REZ2_TRICX|nr:hypothetical protein TNCV_3413631 [Trichonephila clavipes]